MIRSRGLVHPHVRGDGEAARKRHLRRGGSPPRAWGRLVVVGVLVTPTCVGTACRTSRLPSPQSVHPTCVGTQGGAAYSPCPAVHPHVRGDGCTSRSPSRNGVGSPPRAWGRRVQAATRRRGSRFTRASSRTGAERSFAPASRAAVRCAASVPSHSRSYGRRKTGCVELVVMPMVAYLVAFRSPSS